MSAAPARKAPGNTEVELHGIEPISEQDHTSPPCDLFRVGFGGANT